MQVLVTFIQYLTDLIYNAEKTDLWICKGMLHMIKIELISSQFYITINYILNVITGHSFTTDSSLRYTSTVMKDALMCSFTNLKMWRKLLQDLGKGWKGWAFASRLLLTVSIF